MGINIGKKTRHSKCTRRDGEVIWASKQANLTHKINRRGATDKAGRIQRMRSRLEDLDRAGKGKATREPNGGQDASDTNIIGEDRRDEVQEASEEMRRVGKRQHEREMMSQTQDDDGRTGASL